MKVRIAQLTDLPAIEAVIQQAGLNVSQKTMKRYFWEAPCKNTSAIRGGVVVEDDDGKIVGYSGLSPCEVLVKGRPIQAYQMGVLGFLPEYGGEVFDLMDKVLELTAGSLLYANTANEKSSKLWRVYAGFSCGPDNCSRYQFKLLPGGFLTFLFRARKKVFPENELRDILQRVDWKTHTIVTTRTVERLQWLYESPIGSKKCLILTTSKREKVKGYVVLWPKKIKHTPFFRYEMMDVFSTEDNSHHYQQLVKLAKRYAALHGGVMLEYTGVRNLLPLTRKLKSNTSIWHTADASLNEMLQNYPESFFGPYDGDSAL